MHTQFWLVLFKQFRAYPIQTPNPKIKHNVDTRLKLLLLGLSSGHNWLRVRAFIYCNIYFALYSNNLQLLSPTTKRQFITISHHVGACYLFFPVLDRKVFATIFLITLFVQVCITLSSALKCTWPYKNLKMVAFKTLWLMYYTRSFTYWTYDTLKHFLNFNYLCDWKI